MSECGEMGKEMTNAECVQGNWLQEICLQELELEKRKEDDGKLEELLGSENVF